MNVPLVPCLSFLMGPSAWEPAENGIGLFGRQNKKDPGGKGMSAGILMISSWAVGARYALLAFLR